MDELDKVKKLTERGDTEQAILLIDSLFDHSSIPTDELFYLKGNAYRKRGDWHQAINSYLQALDINPESPALSAKEHLMDILNFYHKDMYNP